MVILRRMTFPKNHMCYCMEFEKKTLIEHTKMNFFIDVIVSQFSVFSAKKRCAIRNMVTRDHACFSVQPTRSSASVHFCLCFSCMIKKNLTWRLVRFCREVIYSLKKILCVAKFTVVMTHVAYCVIQ